MTCPREVCLVFSGRLCDCFCAWPLFFFLELGLPFRRSGVRFVTSLGRRGSASSRISSQPGAPAANWRSQEWILQERTRRQQRQQLCLGRVPVLQA